METKLQDVELGKLSVDDYYKYVVRFTENFVSELKSRNFSFNEIPEYSKKTQPELVSIVKSTGAEVFEGKDAFYDTTFLSWISQKQEADKDGVQAPEFRGFYLKKSFVTDKFKMKKDFTKKDIIALTNLEEIEKEFIWLESKNTSKTKLKLDNNLRLQFVKSSGSKQEVAEFSLSGQKIYYVRGVSNEGTDDEKKYSFYHIGEQGSGFRVWGDIFGNRITPEEFAALYQGQKIHKERLVFNNGDSTSGTLYYDADEQRIKAIFDKKVQQGTVVFEGDGHKVEKFMSKENLPYYKIDGKVFVNGNTYGHDITLDDLKDLAINGETYITDFLSKKNTYFPGRLKIINDKIKLVFDE